MQRTQDRERWTAALAVGLLLRAFFVWKHPPFVGDTLIYGDLAKNLLQRHVYGLTEDGVVRATLIRLPGYPLFLAVCFVLFGAEHYMAVLWLQVAVDLLNCWLLADFARRVFGARVGLVCLWLAALCPFTANYAGAALTETLSIFCVTLALWSTERWLHGAGKGRHGRANLGWGVLLGLAWSEAVLLRPDGVLLAGALLPVMVIVGWRERQGREGYTLGGRDRWRALGPPALGLVVLLSCLGAWTVRNWRVYHIVQPLAPKYANDPGESEPLGFARWYRTWAIGYGDTARVYWVYDGSTLDLKDLPGWAFDSPAQRRATQRLYDRYNAETSSTPEIEAAFARLAAERVRAHPLRFYVLLPVAKLADMWFRPRTQLMQVPVEWWRPRIRPRATVFACVYGVLNLGLLLLAVVGLKRWRQLRWAGSGALAAAMVAYVALRSALLLTIDNSEPRYTLECFPIVILLAAVALGLRAGSGASEGRP